MLPYSKSPSPTDNPMDRHHYQDLYWALRDVLKERTVEEVQDYVRRVSNDMGENNPAVLESCVEIPNESLSFKEEESIHNDYLERRERRRKESKIHHISSMSICCGEEAVTANVAPPKLENICKREENKWTLFDMSNWKKYD